MAIEPFFRLVSRQFNTRLGADRDQAALNAANSTGAFAEFVPRNLNPVWPGLEKYDNDTTFLPFSPFGGSSNPEYIWDNPTTDGQTVAFAEASGPFAFFSNNILSFSIVLIAFADNAMKAKIELFEEIGGTFVKAAPQPEGLDEFLLIAGSPNTPAVGLTETQPFNWQNIRVYSTRFTVPPPPPGPAKTIKIVVSFEGTNYLGFNPNPAGLQYMVDIYRDIDTV